jgi:restriction system protein
MRPLKPIFAGAAKAVAARFAFLHRSNEAALPRTKLDTRKWTPELLKQLEWRRFEELCAAYYEAMGFATKISAPGAGGGVDIMVKSKDAGFMARCKAWDAYRVGIKSVLELRSAMAAAKTGKGVLLTSGRFTQEAVTLAGKENIQMIDGAAFLEKLAALSPEKSQALLKFATQGDFLTPTCPSCSIKMTSRQSTREGRKFWGCRNYPTCKHTFAGTASVPA